MIWIICLINGLEGQKLQLKYKWRRAVCGRAQAPILNNNIIVIFFQIRNQLIRIICSLVCLTKPKVSLFRSISCQCFVILFVHVNEIGLAKHLGV